MAIPPPNLPTPLGLDSTPLRGLPGGGADAPDPFGTSAKLPTPSAPPPAAEASPLAPPAFRRPQTVRPRRRTLAFVLVGAIVLLLLGVVAFVAFRLLFSGGSASHEVTPTPTASPASASESPAPTASSLPGSADAAAQVADGDADGLTNAEEAYYRTDPNKADTDGDGFTDSQEVRAGYDPLGPGKLDSDNDGFPDPDEREFGSDPFNPDTDGDGYKDGAEIKNGYNPLIPSPGDKL